MKTTTITKSLREVGLLTIALTLALVANFAYGQWNNPTATPPSNNVAAPINVSTDYQYKAGNFGAVDVIAGNKMRSSQYCDFDGNNCIASLNCFEGQILKMQGGQWVCADDLAGGSTTTVTTGSAYQTFVLNEAEIKNLIMTQSNYAAETGSTLSTIDGVYSRDLEQELVCDYLAQQRGGAPDDGRVVTATIRAWDSPDDNFTAHFDGGQWNRSPSSIRSCYTTDNGCGSDGGPCTRCTNTPQRNSLISGLTCEVRTSS